jgi:hypothetical protein
MAHNPFQLSSGITFAVYDKVVSVVQQLQANDFQSIEQLRKA